MRVIVVQVRWASLWEMSRSSSRTFLRARMIHEIARSTRHRFARTAKPSWSLRRGTVLRVRPRKERAQSMRVPP